MTTSAFSGHGIVFIDAAKAPPNGRLQRNTRLSICSDGEYVAIMDVQLPEDVKLPAGSEYCVPLRMVSDRYLNIGVDYEIRDPIRPIGWLRLTELSPEGNS